MSPPGSPKSLADWTGWLETLSPHEIELGLERVAEVLQRLSLRRPELVIHIAGTNGKGSSVAMLESLLTGRGKSVGCYTSPHIDRYNERFRINGDDIGDEQVLDAFVRIEAVREGVPLTYFEYGTLAALCVFEAAGVQVQLLEVGMGGRLDAVNAVDPDGGIITNVSLDHCAWLGDDVEVIGAEKAGILRGGKPFVFADDAVPDSVRRVADDTGADLRVLHRDYRYIVAGDGSWNFRGRDLDLQDLAPPSLQGAFQVRNAAGVIALLEALGLAISITSETVNDALSCPTLPGRLQLVTRSRHWIVDVAHNAAAAIALGEAIVAMKAAPIETCVIGVLNDKDVAGVVSPLLPYVQNWVAVTADADRAEPATDLARDIANLADKPCRIADSIEAACEAVEGDRDADGTVLLTGSFYTVGPALRWLDARE